MYNSILYYEWITEQNSKLLLMVPHSLQEELMQESHDKITAGHLGAHKMLIRLREHFFWRGMGKACQLYVETCHTCTKQKKLQTKQKAKKKKKIIMLGILWTGFILIYLGRSPSVIMGIVTF